MNRGVEISSEVADSNQAIILDQVENGVASMAVIYLLASKLIKPSSPMDAAQPIETLVITDEVLQALHNWIPLPIGFWCL